MRDLPPSYKNFGTIHITRSGTVVEVTLNRPHRHNALSEEMYRELATLLDEVGADPSARALILQGAGNTFCSGADIGQQNDQPMAAITRMRQHSDVALRLHRLPLPTIAAVDGAAVGAGCNLALGCDLVIATERAYFAELFVKRGMGFDWGGSWLLPRLVGLRRAKELAFFGERIYAAEAAEIGLINRVVKAEELTTVASHWATQLADSAPLSMAMLKEELHMSIAPPFASMLTLETYGQVAQRQTEDAAEGFKSFLEKRSPKFKGL